MRKIFLYLLLIILLVFAIPILFTKQNNIIETSSVKVENIEEPEIKKEAFNYREHNTINLLHQDTGQIEEINLDEYLINVLAAEMPVNYDIEALKAQAIIARTYTLYKIKNGSKHENADICDSPACCQAWISKENRFARWEEENRENNWNKLEKAVYETKGKIVTYNGEVINAFFHSNSGGKTELPVNVWGGEYPYFQIVETDGEDAYSGYSSEVIVSKDELIQKMLEKYENFNIDYDEENCIKILEYTQSNRIKKIKIGNKELSGVEARTIFGLKSTNFSFTIDNNNIVFSVIGYGHGVGLSQSGADSLAKQGYNYERIIKHYYKDVNIIDY